jgi:hypothetical protein
MEEFPMEPGTNPGDLHTILSRFHTWAEQQPGKGNGKAPKNEQEGIRALTYEEAMARFREQQPQQRERRRRKAATRVAPDGASPAATPTLEPPSVTVAAESGNSELQMPNDSPESSKPEPIAIPQEEPLVAASKLTPENVLTGAAQPAIQENLSLARVIPAAEKPSRRGGLQVPGSPKPRRVKTACATAGINPPASGEPVASKRLAAAKAQPGSTAASREKDKPGKSRPRGKQQPEFRQVLANSLRVPNQRAKGKSPAKATPKSDPQRMRRVTTRFSPTEERRLEKAAGKAGMTVSSYLRQCALAAEQTKTARHASAPARRTKRTRLISAGPPAETPLLAQAGSTSLVGGWLTLLRQRFLASPARFSERA